MRQRRLIEDAGRTGGTGASPPASGDGLDPRQGSRIDSRARRHRERACDEAALLQLFGSLPLRTLYPPQPEAKQTETDKSDENANCYTKNVHKLIW